jgi:acyl-CoA thioesterase-1
MKANTCKKILCCGFFLIVLLSGCKGGEQKNGQPQPVLPESAGTIIAVGDSLTAGLGVMENEAYPALLEERLRENGYPYRVVNAGVSGETSSGTLARIDWIISKQPDIVILESGANDALRGLPTKLIRKNLDKAITKLQAKNIEVVLAGMQIVQNLGPEYTASFTELYADLARERHVILIPFFLKGVAGVRRLNQADTIHPTAEGCGIVADTVYPYVVQAIEKKGQIRKN